MSSRPLHAVLTHLGSTRRRVFVSLVERLDLPERQESHLLGHNAADRFEYALFASVLLILVVGSMLA